jgi:protein-disulfide isomerase
VSNRFFVIVLIIIAVIGGAVFFSKSSDQAPANNSQLSEVKTGEGTTGVTLVEWGDFQCPACASYYPIVKQIKEKYGDKITFQFRNLPLSEIHPHAILAARSAMAADKQGKFWEYHDLLYENQRSWTDLSDATEVFDGYAEQLELNMDQFRADRASDEVNSIVQADRAEAQRLGFTGTPTFVLDGQKLDPTPQSFDEFVKKIDEAIAAKQNQ